MAMVEPEKRSSTFDVNSETKPVVLSVASDPSGFDNIAESPAESYPLYSNFLRPWRTSEEASADMLPKMPHTLFRRVKDISN